MKRINHLLIISLLMFFCSCGGSKTNNTNNETKKTEAQDTSQGEQSKSQDLNAGDSSNQGSPEGRIKNIIQEYFALYGKNDWDALAGYYAPEINQFITIKNTTPAQVTASAKSFFKNKSNIAYKPDMSTFKISEAQMQWNVSIALDMQWDDQQSRVQLELAFLDPGYKIVSYKERKVLISKKQTGSNQSLAKLFKSIPQELQVPGMDIMYTMDTTSTEEVRFGFGAVSQVWQAVVKRIEWQGRTILVSVHSGGTSQLTADRQWREFNISTNIYFFEKTASGWKKIQLMSRQTQAEIGKFFAQKNVKGSIEPTVKFQGKDITITQSNKKMNIGWDVGTYRIVSRE